MSKGWVFSPPCPGSGIFCVFPLHHESPRLTLQKTSFLKEQERNSNDRLLFDLQGKSGKSRNLFTSVQGIIHHTCLLPIDTGHISHEFIHEETAQKLMILFKHSWRTNIPREQWRQKFSFGSPMSLAHLSLGAFKDLHKTPSKTNGMLRFICFEDVIILSGRSLEEL